MHFRAARPVEKCIRFCKVTEMIRGFQMSKLNPEYLFKDKDRHNPSALSDYDTLDFVSSDQHIYGEIMWPDGEYSDPRPCVIMLHGFPGSARNDDIAHALCRIGCVVMVPHHRGAWGSEEKRKYLTTLLEEGKILQSDGAEYIYQDVERHRSQMNFEKAFDKIKDQNILCLAGEYDSCAPVSEMVRPLWNKLEAHNTQAIQRLIIYPAEHGLLGCRISAITEIADFLTEICI